MMINDSGLLFGATLYRPIHSHFNAKLHVTLSMLYAGLIGDGQLTNMIPLTTSIHVCTFWPFVHRGCQKV